MLKKLMLGTAISALMLSGAMAQTSTSPAQPMSPPAASSAPSSTPDTSSKAGDSSAASSKAAFVSSQQPDQWLASKFKGTEVLGSDGKKIGDINDLLFDKSGKIEAYVVSVGGFLGMGAKSVAMAPSSFEVVPGQNGAAPKLKTAMTTNELKQAQNFTPYEPPRTTTGSGGGLGSLNGKSSKGSGMH
ncbi:MAG: PRC-barrel domain-containing protein [Pseudolabrys sp.]|jgi:sporulation protein YlmC with PRC-barrel domain